MKPAKLFLAFSLLSIIFAIDPFADVVDRSNLGILFNASPKTLYNTESFANLVLTVENPSIPHLPPPLGWKCPLTRLNNSQLMCDAFEPMFTTLAREYLYLRQTLIDRNTTLSELIPQKSQQARPKRLIGLIIGTAIAAGVAGGAVGAITTYSAQSSDLTNLRRHVAEIERYQKVTKDNFDI